MSPAAASQFEPYSVEHLIAVMVCGAVLGTWIAIGRRARKLGDDLAVRAFGAGAMFMGQVLMQVYWLQPSRFDHAVAWPLHACDLGAWLAPFSILFGARWLRVLLVFWGFAFATQAFIQPTLTHQPRDLQFWFYWLNHLTIVAAAAYEVGVRSVRPTYFELWRSVGLSFVWTAIVFAIDWFAGWNYMFLGQSTPEQTTVVDVLGAWPLRVVWIILIGIAAFHIAWVAIEACHGFSRRDVVRLATEGGGV